MKNVLWILTLVLIVLMPTQWGVHVGGTEKIIVRVDETGRETQAIKRDGGVHVTPGDALLAVVFLLWSGTVIAGRRMLRVRAPAFAVFGLLAVVLASALRAGAHGSGLREGAQLAAYFFGGWLVFANCIQTRRQLKAAVDLFTVVVAAIVLLALWQYKAAASGNAFLVAGTFGNRNVLGTFLAVALPFLFALALFERRLWQRFALALTVAVGAAVTLSGGALLGVAAGVLFVAALKSHKALAATLVAFVLALLVFPHVASLPRHSDVVLSSVRPYVVSNFLDRRKPEPEHLEEPVVATRYKRWQAGIGLIRRMLGRSLLGVGPGTYSRHVAGAYGAVEKPDGDTDRVAGFNIDADEPGTFNMYLVLCAEAGPFALVALLWLGAFLLGRNVRRRFRTREHFGRALALGAAGAVVGAAVCGVFSNLLVRGVAMPFIFVALSGILWAKLPDSPESETSR